MSVIKPIQTAARVTSSRLKDLSPNELFRLAHGVKVKAPIRMGKKIDPLIKKNEFKCPPVNISRIVEIFEEFKHKGFKFHCETIRDKVKVMLFKQGDKMFVGSGAKETAVESTAKTAVEAVDNILQLLTTRTGKFHRDMHPKVKINKSK